MASPTAQQFLSALRTYLGVIESPLGSNRQRVGVEYGWNGVAWCAQTISVAARKAGFGRLFWSASTDVWEANAKRGVNGARWIVSGATPRPGDIAVWDFKRDGTANHVSAVESVLADGKLVTIGGNENHRCQRSVRSKAYLRGYVRMPFHIATVYPSARPILRQGSTGQHVANLQATLNRVSNAGLNISSPAAFGPKTAAAVVAFKRYFGLISPTSTDHVVGPKTWAMLDYIEALKR